MSGFGDTYAEVGSHIRQDTHDDKLCEPYSKATHSQGKQGFIIRFIEDHFFCFDILHNPAKVVQGQVVDIFKTKVVREIRELL
jgi:hypothetical protein